MTKRYFKGFRIIGRVFCLYNTRKTGYFTLYIYNSQFYVKPRITAHKGQIVNGVSNMVSVKACNFGTIAGYQELINNHNHTITQSHNHARNIEPKINGVAIIQAYYS